MSDLVEPSAKQPSIFPRSGSYALLLAGVCTLAAPLTGACGDDGSTEDGGSGSGQLTLQGESELFPGFDYSTGLLPADSPVQASFSVTAQGLLKLSAGAVASGDASSAKLTGTPDSGSLAIEGGFGMTGQLKVDYSGFTYDGPIPGIENISVAVVGDTTFSPFAIGGEPIVVRADIPPTELPGIPLPAPIPGELVLTVAEGSFVEMGFEPGCAGTDGSTALYTGTVERSGTLVIRPAIVIEVPALGSKTFDIPEFSIDLALGSSDLEASAQIAGFASAPGSGDTVTGSCEPGTGGGGAGGDGTGGNGTGGNGTGGTGEGGAGEGGSANGGGGTGGEGGGGNQQCDVGTCDDCQICASQNGCADEYNACNASDACIAFADCVYACTDQACVDQCDAANPGGADPYYTYAACVLCDACPITCDAASVCQ